VARAKRKAGPTRGRRCNPGKYVPVALRRAVPLRDYAVCVYCGAAGSLTLDHVVPRAVGGPTVAANLVTCCRRCNETKAGWPVDLFAVLLERRGVDTACRIMDRVRRQLARPLPEVKSR
jgi:5-methylcytosine-specific restriction endonuclease McrA